MAFRSQVSERIFKKVPDAEQLLNGGLSASAGARKFRIDYRRWYDALPALGLEDVKTFEELLAMIVYQQRKAITFGSLAENLGREVTLGELADWEAAAFATGAVAAPVPRTRKRETAPPEE